MPSASPCSETVYIVLKVFFLPPNNLVEESEEWEKKGQTEKRVLERVNELWEKGNLGR